MSEIKYCPNCGKPIDRYNFIAHCEKCRRAGCYKCLGRVDGNLICASCARKPNPRATPEGAMDDCFEDY